MNNTTTTYNYRTRGRSHWRTKCGYCGNRGHNIVHCRDATLQEFDRHIMNAYAFYKLAFTDTSETFIRFMSSYIESEPLPKIKAYYYSLNIKPITFNTETNQFQRTNINVNSKIDITCEIVFYFTSNYYSEYTTTELTQILYDLPEDTKDELILIVKDTMEAYRNNVDFDSICQRVHATIGRIKPSLLKFDIELRYMTDMNQIRDVDEYHSTECPICLEIKTVHNVLYMNCHHPICYICLLQYFNSLSSPTVANNTPKCCTCRTPITTMYTCHHVKYNYINDKHILNPVSITDVEFARRLVETEDLSATPKNSIVSNITNRAYYNHDVLVVFFGFVYNILIVYCFIRVVISVFIRTS